MSQSVQKRVSGKIRKAKIAHSAAKLFSEKGFSGTKTREIAEKAGVSEALIYKHFPSKEDLYAAILAEESPVPHLLAQVRGLAEERQDEAVFRMIAKTIVEGAPDAHLMKLILYSALENHELSDMFFQNHIKVFYDFLANYIQKRIQEKVFKPVPPLVAARAFMGMLIYHRLLTVLFRASLPQSPAEIVETFVPIFLQGLVAEPKRVTPKPKKKSVNRKSRKRTPS